MVDVVCICAGWMNAVVEGVVDDVVDDVVVGIVGLVTKTVLIAVATLSMLGLFLRISCSALIAASALSNACVNVSLGLGSVYGCCMVLSGLGVVGLI